MIGIKCYYPWSAWSTILCVIYFSLLSSLFSSQVLSNDDPNTKYNIYHNHDIFGSNLSSFGIPYIKQTYHYPTTNIVCQRNQSWPELEFVMPIIIDTNRTARNLEWRDYFLRSLLLFWPVEESKLKITFLFEEELRGTETMDRYMVQELNALRAEYEQSPSMRKHFPTIRVQYHPPNYLHTGKDDETPDGTLVYKSGYERMQYMAFIADSFTNATFISFADGDTMFHTFIDREDIFHEGKAVIHGRISLILKKQKTLASWARSTYAILQKEMPMNCMSYFPVVIHRKHLQAFRDYLMKLHNLKTFAEVFYSRFNHGAGGGDYSQYCLICTYLFWFHRDDYTWFVHDMDPWWDGNHPAPLLGHHGEKNLYTDAMKQITPLVSLHVRYRFHRLPLIHQPRHQHAVYLQSICSALLSTPIRVHDMTVPCELFYQQYEYFDEVYAFEESEFNDKINQTLLAVAFHQRMKRFQGCRLEYVNYELQRMFQNVSYIMDEMKTLVTMKLRHH